MNEINIKWGAAMPSSPTYNNMINDYYEGTNTNYKNIKL